MYSSVDHDDREAVSGLAVWKFDMPGRSSGIASVKTSVEITESPATAGCGVASIVT